MILPADEVPRADALSWGHSSAIPCSQKSFASCSRCREDRLFALPISGKDWPSVYIESPLYFWSASCLG